MGRAEYFRARRAAKRQPPVEQRCEGCGAAFVPQRTDARFHSPACRAAYWRPITHHAVHSLEPHQSQVCIQHLGGQAFCRQPAAWRHESVTNAWRDVRTQAFYCDAHIWAHAPRAEVTVGEELDAVVARHGRESRRRHGSANQVT